MNFAMWKKALTVMPHVTKEEWDQLDIISKWLIATRAAVLIMTFLSAAIAGILAYQQGKFNFWLWLLVTFGLIMAHATNNLFNDITDYYRGVDKDNYYRSQYGPQPLVHGLLSKKQMFTYAIITGAIALSIAGLLLYLRGGLTIWLIVAGAIFVLFYTFPLKYIGLGEIAVLLVWGPLMIGGGFYVITGVWSWNVVLASMPYTLGVTSVIFGKHIDKIPMDKAKNIHTLPVLLGEKISRYAVVGLMITQYLFVLYLVAIRFFSPILLIVFFALPLLLKILPLFRKPKPEEKPADYPDVWPNYFVAAAFVHNRRFGLLYLLGLILDSLIQNWFF